MGVVEAGDAQTGRTVEVLLEVVDHHGSSRVDAEALAREGIDAARRFADAHLR